MPNGGAPARPFSPFRRRRFGLTIVTAFGTVLGSATRRSDCRIRRTTPGAHRDPCRSRSALMLRAQECTSQRPLIKCETARVNASHLVRELMDAATARARASLTFLPLGPDSIAVSAGGRIMPDSGGAPFHMPNPMHDRSAVCAARHLSHSATRRDNSTTYDADRDPGAVSAAPRTVAPFCVRMPLARGHLHMVSGATGCLPLACLSGRHLGDACPIRVRRTRKLPEAFETFSVCTISAHTLLPAASANAARCLARVGTARRRRQHGPALRAAHAARHHDGPDHLGEGRPVSDRDEVRGPRIRAGAWLASHGQRVVADGGQAVHSAQPPAVSDDDDQRSAPAPSPAGPPLVPIPTYRESARAQRSADSRGWHSCGSGTYVTGHMPLGDPTAAFPHISRNGRRQPTKQHPLSARTATADD